MDHGDDLAKWQASSHRELAKRKPSELFETEFAERYDRLHIDLWQRILRLHGTIRTLEQLADFPFDHLYGPNHMEFWQLVGQNFVEMAIVLLHSLVHDRGQDTHTILKFKDEIATATWRDPGMRELLLQTLRDRRFDSNVESVGTRIKKIRDHRIAHRLIDRQTGHLKDQLDAVTLRDLRNLFDAAHSLFGALSFGSGYVTLAGDLVPRTTAGIPTQTCLDKILDAVIRDSYFANTPERRAQWWPAEREHMNPEELRIMNDLRQRIGLPKA